MAEIETKWIGSRRIDPSMPFGCVGRVCDISATRCDLAGGVVVTAPADATVEEIARDVAQAFGLHGASIHSELPSFAGYDTVTITINRR